MQKTAPNKRFKKRKLASSTSKLRRSWYELEEIMAAKLAARL